MGFDVTEASIAELQEAMAAGRTSAAQLVDAYLARIAAYDHAGPELNALIRLNPRARAEAARLDAERREGRVRGPLHGIPIILKDNYDTDDLPTTGGSLALATHRPRRDAFVVARLRAAGAIVLAKANLHELAAGITSISSLGGQTRNPYDPARCPGGSSGGTGAAIAASFAALGWGTDTCGSIRIPSAFGALVGLRPTQGLFSRAGIVPLSHTQDTPGPLARTVRDLAIGLDATVGPDPDDDATRASEGIPTPAFVAALRADALAGTRVGVFAPYFRDAEPDVADTIRAALGAMQRLGATLVEVAMPEFDADIARTSLTRLETKHDLQDYLARPGGAPVRSLSDILAGGLYDKALEARHREEDTVTVRDGPSQQLVRSRQLALRARIVALMDSLHLDALAYPTSTRKPVLIGDPQLGTTCALAANTGLPAISVPAGFTDDGLPTGVELLGRPFSDARLVGFAFALEQAAPRRRPPPTTPPLVAGRAPDATRGTVVVAGAGTTAHADFTFEPTSGALRFGARLDAGAAEALEAVVLRRRDARGERVIARLLGPGMRSARGVVRVTGIDRDALEDGRVSLALYTRASVAAAGERPLRLGSARAAR
ncbi:MAG: amidase [Gemmatimonadetes bacterium]|nr:amidase [Gemmatimonadota bacterium]